MGPFAGKKKKLHIQNKHYTFYTSKELWVYSKCDPVLSLQSFPVFDLNIWLFPPGEGDGWKNELLELARSKQERTMSELHCLRQVQYLMCSSSQRDTTKSHPIKTFSQLHNMARKLTSSCCFELTKYTVTLIIDHVFPHSSCSHCCWRQRRLSGLAAYLRVFLECFSTVTLGHCHVRSLFKPHNSDKKLCDHIYFIKSHFKILKTHWNKNTFFNF